MNYKIEDHIAELLDWLGQILTVPKFDEILVLENSPSGLGGSKPVNLSREELRKIQDYEKRFKDLLSTGPSWIRLQAAGLIGPSLVITVEHSTSLGLDPGDVAVNFAGPAKRTQERPQWQLPVALK